MRTLGVILARGGSKGLTNKHLRPLLDRPVIDYTFDHARAARRLDRVIVSSDDSEILDRARLNKFHAIARPEFLATDDASVQNAMLHAMGNFETSHNFLADALVVLYGNIPVRGDGVIDRAIEMLEKTGCDSVRSFCPVGKWHAAWMAKLQADHVVPVEQGSIHRRQDLPPLFLHDGAVVAVTRESMLRGRSTPNNPHAFFGIDRRGFETGIGETIEVDHLRDLYWAEAVLRERAEQAKAA